MMRRILRGSLASVGLLLLILDAKTALFGASEGITLCLRSVIPSLFPFFVLSILLVDALTGLSIPILRPIGKICRIPSGAEPLLAVGMIGGYPVGAQSVSHAYQKGQLSEKAARRMLGFCSNAGPAFLFGMIAAKFPNLWMAWALWGIHILSALFVGVLLPGKSERPIHISPDQQCSVADALKKSITVMAGVCGWIVVFRVILSFLSRWFLWLLPDWSQVAITGVLELANGCCALDRIENIGLRFIVCSGILSFGGICVSMQTCSVIDGLGMGWYLPGKLMQGLISVFLAAILQMLILPANENIHVDTIYLFLMIIILTIYSVLLHKLEKKSSISVAVGV